MEASRGKMESWSHTLGVKKGSGNMWWYVVCCVSILFSVRSVRDKVNCYQHVLPDWLWVITNIDWRLEVLSVSQPVCISPNSQLVWRELQGVSHPRVSVYQVGTNRNQLPELFLEVIKAGLAWHYRRREEGYKSEHCSIQPLHSSQFSVCKESRLGRLCCAVVPNNYVCFLN